MNSIIILPEEFVSDKCAVLTGVRAAYAIATHDLKLGLRLRAATWGGPRGHVQVQELSSDSVVFATELNEPPLPTFPVDLIVAVPRPQTVKKLLQLAAMVGIGQVHLVRSQNVVKSYLSSKGLHPESIKSELIKGLEQGGDSTPPEVLVHPLFRPFIEDVLPGLLRAAGDSRFSVLASTRAGVSMGALKGVLSRAGRFLVALGPESGWTEHEEAQFKGAGFEAVSLGPRIMRVETAAAWILGQLDLVRAL